MTVWQKQIVLARGRRWTWMVLRISNKILRWEGDYCADESEHGFLCLHLREGKSPFRRVDGIIDKNGLQILLGTRQAVYIANDSRGGDMRQMAHI